MISKITEKAFKRMLATHEEKMKRIIENGQEERMNCRNLSFKLIGILNIPNIIPAFVIPIFICLQDEPEEPNEINKPYYFQVTDYENDNLICFLKLDDYIECGKKIVRMLSPSNSYVNTVFNVYSIPLYAFAHSETNVHIGDFFELKDFFTEYQTEDKLLKEEIQDFLQLESKFLWKKVRLELERAFPDDSADEIEMKLKTLRNNDFSKKDLELYLPKFQDVVLRVGVRVKGEKKKLYFSTQYEKVLADVIDD